MDPLFLLRRLVAPLALLLLFLFLVLRDGWLVGGFTGGAIAMVWVAGAYLMNGVRRPARSYLLLLLGSAMLALLFVVMPMGEGSHWLLGVIAWAGVSFLGLVWTIYYETSEPPA